MVNFVVKTRGNVPVVPDMRSVFHEVAPGIALDNFQTMQEAVEKNTFSQRLGLYLVGSFAGLAIAMVIAGLYGVLSQLVSYRRREIGVRMALGATRSSVATLVLRQGIVLIGAGLAAGLVLAFAVCRLITGFLYQVKPLDAWTYVAVGPGVAGHRPDRGASARAPRRFHPAHAGAAGRVAAILSPSCRGLSTIRYSCNDRSGRSGGEQDGSTQREIGTGYGWVAGHRSRHCNAAGEGRGGCRHYLQFFAGASATGRGRRC